HLPSRAVSVPGRRAATARPASAGVRGRSCGALRRPSPAPAPLWKEGTTGSLLFLPSCSLPFPTVRAAANPAGKQQRACAIACIQKLFLGKVGWGRAHWRFLEFAQAPAAVVFAPASPVDTHRIGAHGCCRCQRLPLGCSACTA